MHGQSGPPGQGRRPDDHGQNRFYPLVRSPTLIITDGEPDSEADALAAAAEITGRIDVIYCGREDNRRAIDFLSRLARSTGGRADAHSWDHAQTQQLAGRIKTALLAAPGRNK